MNFSKQEGAASLVAIIAIVVIMVCAVALLIGALKPNTEVATVAANETNTNTISPLHEDVTEPEEETEANYDDPTRAKGFTYSFLDMENQSAKGKNVIYSPLSIKYALKLLVEGAEGDTKTQIENLIKDEEITKYKNIKDVLSLANAVYIREEYKDTILDTYTDTVKDNYDAEVLYDEFKDAKNVNSWIEDKTFGIIKDLLKDNQVQNPNLRMILINALAIDMEWKSSFSTDDTFSGTFDKDGKNLEVAMMHKKETLSENIAYKIDDNVTVLAMDLEEYEGVQLEFDAIMPNHETLDTFINDRSKDNIDYYLKDLTKASETEDGLNISIPKFDFDYSIDLKEELKAMGMKDAFEMNADFSKMTGDQTLYVGDAIHKADIEFSEDGIKAAAVTAFMMLAKSALMEPTHPIEVTIDKPFMFVIRDKETGEVWFTGAVYEPVLWENVKEEYRPQF